MLAAVDFYDQPPLQAYEVNDVWPNRALATEFVALDLTEPEVSPQSTLGIRQVCSQLAGP